MTCPCNVGRTCNDHVGVCHGKGRGLPLPSKVPERSGPGLVLCRRRCAGMRSHLSLSWAVGCRGSAVPLNRRSPISRQDDAQGVVPLSLAASAVLPPVGFRAVCGNLTRHGGRCRTGCGRAGCGAGCRGWRCPGRRGPGLEGRPAARGLAGGGAGLGLPPGDAGRDLPHRHAAAARSALAYLLAQSGRHGLSHPLRDRGAGRHAVFRHPLAGARAAGHRAAGQLWLRGRGPHLS